MTVKKVLKFCCAHRLLNYSGKCRNLHGHNYTVEVEVERARLDDAGFVVDFGDIKELIGTWIDENWDHGTIAKSNDEALIDFCIDVKSKYYVLPSEYRNSTAESMADFLFNKFKDELPGLRSISLWETDTGMACCSE